MYEGRLPLELGASLWLEGWFFALGSLHIPCLSCSLALSPFIPKEKERKGRFLALDLNSERI